MSALLVSYPAAVLTHMQALRDAVYRVAAQHADVGQVTEAIKWGEHAFLAPQASTVRLAWPSAKPTRYALHFHCQTKLVETFRELHGDQLVLEGRRAMVFELGVPVPMDRVEHCLYLALTYHRRKHLPMLDA